MKAEIKNTGKIVDVISFSCRKQRGAYDTVTYKDNKGAVYTEHINYYLDLKERPDLDYNINWEQRKFELAKDLFLFDYQNSRCKSGETLDSFIAKLSITAIHNADRFLSEYKDSFIASSAPI